MPKKEWPQIADLLSKYQAKRDFDKTAEPSGNILAKPARKLRFVIQEHWATRHHFDLRLELDGVLKSWAIPRKVPEVEKEKYLAVQVEDHPLDYMYFEGQIPEGEYGGGKVKIWDKGFYRILEQTPSKWVFLIAGQRISGRYALIRFSNDKKNWLLIKEPLQKQNPKSKVQIVPNQIQNPKFKVKPKS